MVSLDAIVRELDSALRIDAIEDWPNALNGLQLENKGTITRVCAAVDAAEFCLATAAETPGTLLIVHHGLFWQGLQPVTGAMRRKLARAIAGDLALYSAHLPLDVHPTWGNNPLLCKALGFDELEPFFLRKGQPTGCQFSCQLTRQELVARLEKAVDGPVKICPGGPDRVRRVGVVTGGAGTGLLQAAEEGVDTFITGEGAHWTFAAAEECGINLLYAGHYATETFGVKALAAHVAERFGLPWEFIDHPSGL
jgi:dinuclear metal center YbgI/SA1388 family protein